MTERCPHGSRSHKALTFSLSARAIRRTMSIGAVAPDARATRARPSPSSPPTKRSTRQTSSRPCRTARRPSPSLSRKWLTVCAGEGKEASKQSSNVHLVWPQNWILMTSSLRHANVGLMSRFHAALLPPSLPFPHRLPSEAVAASCSKPRLGLRRQGASIIICLA